MLETLPVYGDMHHSADVEVIVLMKSGHAFCVKPDCFPNKVVSHTLSDALKKFA